MIHKLLTAGLLLAAHVAMAQTAPVIPVASDRAIALRDTLFKQARAIQADAAAKLAQFNTITAAVGGLRTITTAHAAGADGRPYRLKRHVVKRKTSGWLREIISYYDSRGRLLREEYQNGQLATLHLNTYSGAFYSDPYQVFTFTQGDYLRRSIYPAKRNVTNRSPSTHEYLYFPAPKVRVIGY